MPPVIAAVPREPIATNVPPEIAIKQLASALKSFCPGLPREPDDESLPPAAFSPSSILSRRR